MSYKRDRQSTLLEALKTPHIILLLGARQTGKTTLLKQVMEVTEQDSLCYFLNLENPEYKKRLNEHPENLYEIIGIQPGKSIGKHYIFIDEIQYLDNPSNFLKYIYDEYRGQTKLVVSGSSSFYIDRKFRDSLTGRKKVFNLYGLNFGEFLRFKEEKKLEKLVLSGAKINPLNENKLKQLLSEYVTYGGYPEVVLTPEPQEKLDLLEAMSFDYIRKDIFEAKIQDEEKYFHLLKILAHQCGQIVNVNELANTLNLSQPTVENYLYTLQKSFHIALIKPYYKNIRKELSKMKKVYFYDLGLRNSLMGNFTPLDLREEKGAAFENIFFRETLYKHNLEHIKYWRTIHKNEVDFILREKKAYEIKYNSSAIQLSKYKTFQKMHPAIDLNFVTHEDLMDFIHRPSK